jgi:hypothetical protein
MNDPEHIEFAYPRWFAVAALWLWLPLLALIILTIVSSGLFALHTAHAKASLDLLAYAQAMLVICVGVWMGGSFVHWVRDRHAFHSRYQLSESGILVQTTGTEERLCLWSDIDRCVDSRLGRYVKLWSPKLSDPVTLQFGTSGSPRVSPAEKLGMARRLVREKLGSKYEKIWW